MRPNFEEITNFQSKGKYKQRLCLDLDKKNGTFRLVWRGNKLSVNGFINRPADFDFSQLAKLIIKAYSLIDDAEIRAGLGNFVKILCKKIK